MRLHECRVQLHLAETVWAPPVEVLVHERKETVVALEFVAMRLSMRCRNVVAQINTDRYYASLGVNYLQAGEELIRVLVADDSAISRKLVEHTLSEKRYSLVFAKSGRETVALFAEHHPALVIVDWMMPDLTGIEICKHIRSITQGSYTYIILLTGMSGKESLIEGLAAGADDYLTKPFHPEELIARVGVGFRIMELQREIEVKNAILQELALTDPRPTFQIGAQLKNGRRGN